MKQAIHTLKNNNNIIIKPADKNLGPTIINTTDYITAVTNHIHNNFQLFNNMEEHTTYIQNIFSQLETHTNHLTNYKQLNKTKNLNNTQYYNIQLYNYILNNKPQTSTTPTLYLIPKLHKTTIDWRPIVGAHSYITTNLSIFFSKLLLNFTKQQPTHLKNSHSLLQHINNNINPILNQTLKTAQLNNNNNNINTEIFIITGDITSLYPNININKLIKFFNKQLPNILNNTTLKLPNNTHSTTTLQALNSLLQLLLNSTTIQHPTKQNTFALQTSGIPMGTNAAVELANFYLSQLEDKHNFNNNLQLNHKLHSKIITYKRYIDDIFIILIGTIEDVTELKQQLNNMNNKIHINFNNNYKHTEFLDLEILLHKNNHNNQYIIHTKTHQKLLNKYLYIPYNSFHPQHTKLNWIKAELTRYARLSSNITYFNHTKQQFYQRLIARGYPHSKLNKIFTNFNYETHHHKIPNNNDNENKPFTFTVPFNPTTINFNPTTIFLNNIYLEAIPKNYRNIVTAWKQPNNLYKKLVRAKEHNKT